MNRRYDSPESKQELLEGLRRINYRNNGGDKTVYPPHEKDPYTGHVKGLRHSACRSCGHRRIVSSVTGLCGTQSCIKQRQKKYSKRQQRRKSTQGTTS